VRAGDPDPVVGNAKLIAEAWDAVVLSPGFETT
jgi:hypothetical protein